MATLIYPHFATYGPIALQLVCIRQKLPPNRFFNRQPLLQPLLITNLSPP